MILISKRQILFVVLFFAIFAASLVAIVTSSRWVVASAVELAETFKLSKVAVGVILLAVVASLPEVMIAILSASRGAATLSVGNVFGASLIDMSLVIGLMVLYAGTLTLTRKEVLKMLQFLFIASLVPIIVFFRGAISTGLGLILLALFGAYIIYIYRREKAEMLEAGAEAKREFPERRPPSAKEKLLLLAKFTLSLFVLIFAADFLVDSALDIADFFAVGATFIGATVLALGTALPELSISVRAAKRGEQSLALADLFGASITDLTLVLGTASVIGGLFGAGIIPIAELAGITTALPFLVISVLAVWYMLSEYGRISLYGGLGLLAMYTGFLMELTGFTVIFSILGSI